MMNLGKNVSVLVQILVAAVAIAALVAACGGGGGFVQTYTSTAGVGEVLQLGVNTSAMTYTYQVSYTSYGASGVVAGQNSTGALLASSPGGSYILGPSKDGFILGGKLFPLQSGLLAGHVQLAPLGSTSNVPVLGLANPVSSVVGISGVYSYQGFSCSALGIANVRGNSSCFSRAGTVSVGSSGVYTVCQGGDLNTSPRANPCVSTSTGTISVLTATSGVFDFRNAANAHIGWFFAFNAPDGKKIAVIDHDDSVSIPPMFGHSILTSYASAVSGVSDGSYFVSDNEGGEQNVTVSGFNLAVSAASSASGTMTLNAPWPGLNAFQLSSSGLVSASGVVMIPGTGVFSYTSKVDSAVFGEGIRYGP